MLQTGHNIEQIRLSKGLTREQFSVIFQDYGLNPDKLYSYEKGKAKPNEVLLAKFAEYAGVSVEDFAHKRISEVQKQNPEDVIRHYEDLVSQLQETIRQQKALIDKLMEKM